MTKIGTLTCLHSNDVCARVGCLKAFMEREAFFKEYSQDTCLAAMMTCNGCKSMNPAEPDDDKGILEKIDRLVSEDIKVMHNRTAWKFFIVVLLTISLQISKISGGGKKIETQNAKAKCF